MTEEFSEELQRMALASMGGLLLEIQQDCISERQGRLRAEAALRRIIELDPLKDGEEGTRDEWGYAEMFSIAEEIAKEALDGDTDRPD